MPAGESPLVRFGVFELNLASGELRKSGSLIRLQPQPFKVLALLLENPGEVVTRDEIQKKVWGDDTFVDFEHGLNFCIKQIRQALNDDADAPRYVETLPRRGYRFIAPVERPGAEAEPAPAAAPAADFPPAAAAAEAAGAQPSKPPRVHVRREGRNFEITVVVPVLLVLLLGVGLAGWQLGWFRPQPPEEKVILLVLPFRTWAAISRTSICAWGSPAR